MESLRNVTDSHGHVSTSSSSSFTLHPYLLMSADLNFIPASSSGCSRGNYTIKVKKKKKKNSESFLCVCVCVSSPAMCVYVGCFIKGVCLLCFKMELAWPPPHDRALLKYLPSAKIVTSPDAARSVIWPAWPSITSTPCLPVRPTWSGPGGCFCPFPPVM